MLTALRSVYARALPLRHRLAIGQLRQAVTGRARIGSAGGLLRFLRLDYPEVARSLWQRRFREAGEQWTRQYWNDRDAPQRKEMMAALRTLPHFETVLELGSNAGTNLRLVREEFPHTTVTGVDLSEGAVECARRYFADAGISSATFHQGSFDDVLPRFEDQAFDVVLGIWSLCCCPPSEIQLVMDEAVRVGRSFVVVEPMVVGDDEPELASALPTWKHNYERMFTARGAKVTVLPVQLPEVDHLVIATFA